jgi:hypothetical protein
LCLPPRRKPVPGYNEGRAAPLAPRKESIIMPVHDWTRVRAGIFHDFHREWITEIKRALNRTFQGTDYYALAEQIAGGVEPDVLALHRRIRGPKPRKPAGQPPPVLALADSPPKIRFRIKSERTWYARKAKAVTIRHVSEHRVVAVLEILSPGNKSSRGALADFVGKAHRLLAAGIHLAFVDLIPPTKRDPEGIHPLIWGEDEDGLFHFSAARPLTCASYIADTGAEAFVEPVAFGDVLPNLPLFLTWGEYVPVSLEATYQAAIAEVPEFWREALTTTGIGRPPGGTRKRSRG